MVNRKQFLHLSAASAAGLLLPSLLLGSENNSTAQANPVHESLAGAALNEARAKGAAYADVRIAASNNGDAYEAGIRALVDGRWGFAHTSDVTAEGITKCVDEAVANAALRKSPRHQYDLKVKHELWRCALLKQV